MNTDTQDKVVIGFLFGFVISCLVMIISMLFPQPLRMQLAQIGAIGLTVSFLVLIGFIAYESGK